MTPLSLRPLALPLLLLGSSASTPVVHRDDVSDQAVRKLAERFEATVRCEPDGCGTLIAPSWVLTAAHVARGLSPFSPRVHVGGEERRVRRVAIHPEAVGEPGRPPRVDLALLELAEAVEHVAAVPPYTASDEAGRSAYVVGYGDFGVGGGRLTRGDGERRAATNTIDRAEDGRLFLDFDAPGQGTQLEGVGGPGDSGGPLFVETDSGLFVAGVSSGSMGGRPGNYGVVDVYVRVSALRPWIEDTLREPPADGDAGPRIVEYADLEDGPRAELLAAFFECFAARDEDVLAAFFEDHASADARRRNPPAAFARRMLGLAAEHGALEPVRVAQVAPAHWIVLARGDEGWHGLSLRFGRGDDAQRLHDLGLRPEHAPD